MADRRLHNRSGRWHRVSCRFSAYSSTYLSVVTLVIVVLVGAVGVRRRWWGVVLLVAMSVVGLFVFVTTEPPVTPGGEALGTADQGIGLLLTNSVNVIIYLQEAVGGPGGTS